MLSAGLAGLAWRTGSPGAALPVSLVLSLLGVVLGVGGTRRADSSRARVASVAGLLVSAAVAAGWLLLGFWVALSVN